MNGLAVSLTARQQTFQLEAELQIPPGIQVLFGPSGAGKSTLLDAIAGFIPADRLTLTLGKLDLATLAPRQRGIGYGFQTPALFPHLSVRENVEFGMAQLPRRERRQTAEAMLARTGLLPLAAQRVTRLSGGERQRVALARVLAPAPRVVLLDEPFSALDAESKHATLAFLQEWNMARPIPILYVTHALEEALTIGQNVFIMQRGAVVRHGPAREVLQEERGRLLQALS